MAFNLVILTGRLTKEPELKFGASGTAYCKFTLAVNRMKKDDPADFIFCSAFGKTAELIGQYVKKGNQLGIQGRIQQETWEKEGRKESKTGVVVDKIEFLENNKDAKENETPKKSNKVALKDVKVDLDLDLEFPFN